MLYADTALACKRSAKIRFVSLMIYLFLICVPRLREITWVSSHSIRQSSLSLIPSRFTTWPPAATLPLFLAEWYSRYTHLSLHPCFCSWHSGYFHALAAVNKAAVNRGVQIFLQMSVFLFFGELLDHMGVLAFTVKRTSIVVSTVNSQTQTTEWWLPEGKGVGASTWGKGIEYVAMGGSRTWGGEHAMEYTGTEF